MSNYFAQRKTNQRSNFTSIDTEYKYYEYIFLTRYNFNYISVNLSGWLRAEKPSYNNSYKITVSNTYCSQILGF